MPPEPGDAIEVALLVARAVESVGGAYFIGGSVASSFQGEPRATNDIDIVLEIPLGQIGALVTALGPSFEVDIDMLRDALLHGRTCNIFFLPLLTKVDLFALGPSPFDQSEFLRPRGSEAGVDGGPSTCTSIGFANVATAFGLPDLGGSPTARSFTDLSDIVTVGASTVRYFTFDIDGDRKLALVVTRDDAAPAVGDSEWRVYKDRCP